MKSLQSSKKYNFLHGSAYRFLLMLVNYVQNLAKSLDNNLPLYPEWINIFGLHRTIVRPTWNTTCQMVEVPLKVPLGFY